MSFDISPPIHRGMTALDRNAFRKTVDVVAARISAPRTGEIRKYLEKNKMLLNLPKVHSVVPDPEDPQNGRLVLLGVQDKNNLSEEVANYLNTNSSGFVMHPLNFDYDYWTADDILKATLPSDLCETTPTSFTTTGHIGHFNIREEFLPYKFLIGQVILDKNRTLRTVVNKLDTIDTEFRVFRMEVIAGEEDFNVVLNESGCSFAFDFSKVYWNSRLQNEHLRLINLFQPGEVIADVFAGIGPFAVPSAKKGCLVLGNDLNPDSSQSMEQNAIRNKVQNWIRISNSDGRDFIRRAAVEIWENPFPANLEKPKSAKERAKEHKLKSQGAATNQPSPTTTASPPRRRIDHFVMNLPATAIEFLDGFQGVFAPIKHQAGFNEVYSTMPMVHCHCFTKEKEPVKAEEDIRERAKLSLGTALREDVTCHWVRAVAPNKDMYCISFRLPREVALGENA
ncbi:tRNA(m(1)G37)methyltransferase [Tulasnella sp. 419]|nr:tRNA(m(1)G37)methyltransferase [Tulasnella sp. 419]